MNTLRNLGILILVNGFIALMVAMTLWFGWRSVRLTTQGESTIGHVVELEESTDGEGSCCVYSPIIEFTAPNGRPVRFEGGNASSPPAYRIGQEVEVLYNPQDHQDASINSFYELWLVPAILAPVDVILFVVLNWVAIANMRRGQSAFEGSEE
ncbi:MAG: DUF3592 domain-containing protein [Anaerolineales bacterium]|nr:DUF3592 domain-containing protein [Anaerolineales bacterium]MCL4257822.1 DUF3592 domain-containing protein [Anaerolineales bacterium]QYK50418.1 MAG: DUF3592 domain-containing protein [Anaerolineales bacterium]